MVLVDSSVWVGHLRKTDKHLSDLLDAAHVLMHPHVIGELACGNLKGREMILRYFRAMPPAAVATDDEVMSLLEQRKLWGAGIGWVDAHLVASALLSGCHLWTLDEPLNRVAEKSGVQYQSI